MKKDEQAVQDLQACMKDFDAAPFDISSPTLRSLTPARGPVPSPELVHDLRTALTDGQAQVETLELSTRASFHKDQVSHRYHPQEQETEFRKRTNLCII